MSIVAEKKEKQYVSDNARLMAVWNWEKNNGLTPTDVMPNSHHKVWWKCNEGHEWQATIAHRNNGRGCPECYRIRLKKQQHKSSI